MSAHLPLASQHGQQKTLLKRMQRPGLGAALCPPRLYSNMSGPKVEAAKALLASAWLKSKSVVLNKTKWELLTLEATDEKPWGPTGQQMNGEEYR